MGSKVAAGTSLRRTCRLFEAVAVAVVGTAVGGAQTRYSVTVAVAAVAELAASRCQRMPSWLQLVERAVVKMQAVPRAASIQQKKSIKINKTKIKINKK